MNDRFDMEASLKRRGVTQAEIAARTHYTRTLVWLVMQGLRRNAAVERELARALDVPVAQVRRIVRAEAARQVAA